MPGMLEWVAGRAGFAVEGSWSGSKRVFRQGAYRVEVDPRGQELRLDIPKDSFRNPGAKRLHGSYASTVRGSSPVPMAALAQKAKIFDDGLYAAVELAVQEGAGNFGGKADFLRAVLASLQEDVGGGAPEVLFGAARLGKLNVPEPASLGDAIASRVTKFLDDEKESKPLGFYTWSRDLSRIFQQDRMLQSSLDRTDSLERLVRVLHGSPELRNDYEHILNLFARLTNALSPRTPSLMEPLRSLDAGSLEWKRDQYHFMPPSRSHEIDLFYQIVGGNAGVLDENLDLMKEVIKAIRSGKVDTTPRDDSGWYDYQTWANACLLQPERLGESRSLSLSDRYREHLEALFKGMQALARETHVKQLERGVAPTMAPAPMEPVTPPPVVRIRPSLSVEPLPSFYWRRALGYRFVKEVVARFLGTEALEASLRRWTVSGPVRQSLGDELDAMCGLFNGAARRACRDLGLEKALPDDVAEIAEQAGLTDLGSGRGDEQDEEAFACWDPRRDADLSRDVRMMVPVFHDERTGRTKVWAFLGWRRVPVKVGFTYGGYPKVKVFDGSGSEVERVDIRHLNTDYKLAQPVFAEVWVNRILNRRHFRWFCNWHRTEEKIVKALYAPPPPVSVVVPQR